VRQIHDQHVAAIDYVMAKLFNDVAALKPLR